MAGEYAPLVRPLSMSRHALGLGLGRVLLGGISVLRPWVPRRILKAVDDRFFGAVFQVTRVTNDNYDSSTTERPARADESG